jgi:hypothetical protein
MLEYVSDIQLMTQHHASKHLFRMDSLQMALRDTFEVLRYTRIIDNVSQN